MNCVGAGLPANNVVQTTSYSRVNPLPQVRQQARKRGQPMAASSFSHSLFSFFDTPPSRSRA
ncbi:hypothetical protein E8E68_11765 [Pseudomonas sp. BN607]|nr:hypothetical protein [Pseudomonas sp. BN607]